MIRELIIKNFQTHENTYLQFAPGVNAITGPSDVGKSAVVRALYWLFNNRPAGNAFVNRKRVTARTWVVEVGVILDGGDGTAIVRAKEKSRNIYRLGDREFTAFGQAVPDDIIMASNMSAINFQLQHDAPFLISKSPGEIAQHFNNLVNIDVIDTGLSNITKTCKTAEREVEASRMEIERLKDSLSQYDHLVDLEQKIIKLEVWEKERQALCVLQSKLKRALNQIEEAKTELERCKEEGRALRLVEKPVDRILTMIKEREELKQTRKRFQKILHQIAEAKSQIGITKEKRQVVEEELSRFMPAECPLCGQEIVNE